MDARKWRIRKRDGVWCVFEPNWVFHPFVTSTSFGKAVGLAHALRGIGAHTQGRREQ